MWIGSCSPQNALYRWNIKHVKFSYISVDLSVGKREPSGRGCQSALILPVNSISLIVKYLLRH